MFWLTATLFTQWIGGINVDIYRKDCPQAVLILLADGKIFPKKISTKPEYYVFQKCLICQIRHF
jgi:hypothetical protein